MNKTKEELIELIQNDALKNQDIIAGYQLLGSLGTTPNMLPTVNNLFVSKLEHKLPAFREAALLGLDMLWSTAQQFDLSILEVTILSHTKQAIIKRALIEPISAIQFMAIEMLQPQATFR